MADDIPNDLIPAEQAEQSSVPNDLVPADQVPAAAPVSSAIPNDLVSVQAPTQVKIPTPAFDQRRIQDVNDTDPEKQVYLTPQDITAQNSAYADMYAAGQNKKIDSLEAAQAIKAKYPFLQNANSNDIKWYIEHYRAGGNTFPDFVGSGDKGLVVSKKQEPVSTVQNVAGHVADFYQGVGEGFNSLESSLDKGVIRGVAALQGGDAPDKAEKFISEMEANNDDNYENPTGWSRFGGNLVGGAAVYAPVAEVSPFADMGPIGHLADTTLQGGLIGGAGSGGKDIPENVVTGAVTGAALHGAVTGLVGGVGLARVNIPDALARHFSDNGTFGGMKRLVFGTDNPKVTAQTFEPEFTNPQAPYSANRQQHLANIKAAIDDVTQGWESSPDFNIIGSTRNLTNAQRAEIRQGGAKPADVHAWVGKDGKVNVIANNIDDPSRIPAIVYHELTGHVGLKKAFGDGLDDLLKRVYDTNWRARAYTDDYISNNPSVYKDDPSGQHIRVTEEYLASGQENGPQTVSNWDRVKNYVRSFGRDKLGMDLRYNDDDVKYILAQAHAAAKGTDGRVALDGGRFMYTGQKGAENIGETSNLEQAKQMEEGGGDSGRNGEIRQDTGWFKGPDGKWRQEISDDQSYMKNRGVGSLMTGLPTKLPDVLSHPELYKRYPHLNDTYVLPLSNYDKMTETRGAFDPSNGNIHLDATRDNAHSILLHETQHSIQNEEKFSSGGNPETALHRYPYETLASGIKTFIDHYQAAADHWTKAKEVVDQAKDLPSFKDARDWMEKYNDATVNGDYNGASEAYENAIGNINKFWKDFGYRGKKDYDGHPSYKEFQKDPTARAIISDLRDGIDYGRNHSAGATYKAEKANDHALMDIPELENAFKSGKKEDLIEATKMIMNHDAGFEGYNNLLGEIEARDTQARQKMTGKERAETPPYSTFDFKNNHVGLGGEGSVDPTYSLAKTARETHVDPIRDEDHTGEFHHVITRDAQTGEPLSTGRAYVDDGRPTVVNMFDPKTGEPHVLSPEDAQGIRDKVPTEPEQSPRFSLRRNGKDSLTRTGQDIASAVRDENKTTQTWDETEQKAANLGLTPGKLFKKNVFDAKPETAVAISNVVDDLVNKSSAIEERVARGEGTARDIQMQASALARAVHALEIFEGHKSDIGRSLNILGALKDIPYDQLKDIDVGRLSDPQYVQDVTFKLNKYKNDPLARAQILKGISKGLPEDVITGMHYDMMLSGLHTQSRNIFGQTSNLLADMLAAKPAGIILGHTSNVLKDLTGAGSKSDVMSMKEYGARWFGIIRSLSDLGTWKQTAQSFQEMHPLSKTDQQYSTQTKNPLPYADYGRRTLAAVDNLMHSLMVNSDYYGAAVRDAEKSGKTGAAFWDHVDMKVKNPTDAMTKAANTYASDLSLIGKSDGVLAQAINSITRAPSEEEYIKRAVRFLVMNTVPWLRVPANAVRTMFESNLLTTGLSRNTRAAFSSEGSSIARQTAIAKATIGTALAGYFSYQYLQGNLRRNPQTYNIEYKSGNQWHSMNGMDALNVIAGPAMSMTDAVKGARNKDAVQAWAGIINGFSGTVMSEGFGTQLADLMEALNPRGTGAVNRLLTKQLQSWEPALGRDVARQMDPIVRDSNVEVAGTDKLGRPVQERDWTKTLGNKLLENIPGQSQTLPAKLDINGQPVTRPTSLTGLFDTTPVDNDPVNKELARLSEKTGKPIVNPVRLLSTQGQGEAGQRAHDIVSQMISSPVWDKIPDNKKVQLIVRQYSNARAAYRRVDKANAKASAIPSDLIPAN